MIHATQRRIRMRDAGSIRRPPDGSGWILLIMNDCVYYNLLIVELLCCDAPFWGARCVTVELTAY